MTEDQNDGGMTEVQLIHKGRTQGKWLSIEQMLADLNAERIQLEPGDHLVVGACGPTRSGIPQRDVRDWIADVTVLDRHAEAQVIPFRRAK